MNNTKTFSTVKGETFTRHLYNVDVDFNADQKCVIFTHGKSNYNLWFTNKSKKLCLVSDASKGRDDQVYLTIKIDVKGKSIESKLSLDRFLYLVEIGDFNITNVRFRKAYLKPFEESKYYIDSCLSA